ncbi:phospholipase A2 [Deinococcus sp.]|uniref:phospholipase A2 n=1 Tax=Deinococcus sp. TaxID=47478 RepID=UPI0025D2270E|nr:phospholipase A2 [Deinococcus sp.]
MSGPVSSGSRRFAFLLGLGALLAACAPAASPTSAAAEPLNAQGRLAYVKALAWGSMQNFEAAYASQASNDAPYPDLDWSRDGCSAPPGLDLGYGEVFRPACNIHDFGYRNLRVLERTPQNRETTDHAFYADMQAICAALIWIKRPECSAAALIYESGVRLGGTSHF